MKIDILDMMKCSSRINEDILKYDILQNHILIQFSKIIRNLAKEAKLRVGENVHLKSTENH